MLGMPNELRRNNCSLHEEPRKRNAMQGPAPLSRACTMYN